MSKRETHRYIRERWVITGTLTLKTPANFGGDGNDSTVDMTVLKYEADGMPFIPGTSIAGALRSYLRDVEKGYDVPFSNKEKERKLASTTLFGVHRKDDEGIQSPLIIFDAPGMPSGFELRDGVKIDSTTRTATEKHKFDIELLCAGSTFDLRFELIVSEKSENRQKLFNALATALDGLAKGDIPLGARKTRGYGRCSVSEWTVRHYNMADPSELLAWLASEREGDSTWVPEVPAVKKNNITEALGGTVTLLEDNRQSASLHAEFSFDGPVMIRSGFSESYKGPDVMHLHSPGPGKPDPVPIIPGTSWAGILRHRAERIVRILTGNNSDKTTKYIDHIFGPSKIEETDENTWASRLSVAESRIDGGHSMIQSRIKIDRFTGGAYESALFEEQPVFGNQDSLVGIDIILKLPPKPVQGNGKPDDADVGLLLLLLKDLWTGDLPVGGESSIGRGRLRGRFAKLNIADQEWILEQNSDGSLSAIGNPDELEQFVQAFSKRMENNG